MFWLIPIKLLTDLELEHVKKRYNRLCLLRLRLAALKILANE
jgi:hypothetical protein